MQDDRDLIAEWAAAEFVAAGRVTAEEERLAHRRRAELFADICQELRTGEPGIRQPSRPGTLSPIASVLRTAFR